MDLPVSKPGPQRYFQKILLYKLKMCFTGVVHQLLLLVIFEKRIQKSYKNLHRFSRVLCHRVSVLPYSILKRTRYSST